MARDQRRLTAIVSADVAGYCRLMGGDESGTLAALKAHVRELINPKITEYSGRTVKSMGDGLLLEFRSVVDAVRCAVDVQRGKRRPRRDCGGIAALWKGGVKDDDLLQLRQELCGAAAHQFR